MLDYYQHLLTAAVDPAGECVDRAPPVREAVGIKRSGIRAWTFGAVGQAVDCGSLRGAGRWLP